MFDEEDLIPPSAPPETIPCLKMWAAKLEVHIKDLKSTKKGTTQLRIAAEYWIFHSTDTAVGSFHWICAILGIEEEAVKRNIHPRWWEVYKKEADLDSIEIPQFKKKKYRTTKRQQLLERIEAMI